MKTAQRILLAVDTSAHWGGLQDWTVGMVKGLNLLGREVGVVTNNALVAERCRLDSTMVLSIDWADWSGQVDEIVGKGPWDVVFAQPFKARELGVYFKRHHAIPLVVMSHGNASDYGYSWVDAADGILLASSSIRRTMVDFNGFDNNIVDVLVNGASDIFFAHPVTPYREKLSTSGDVSVVLASRLGVDKLNQIPAMELLVESLLDNGDIRNVAIEVLGGGPMRNLFESRLRKIARSPRAHLSMLGWVDEKVARDRMSKALFTVAGGVSGTQSCCLGTASLGAGLRSVVGVTTPTNMDMVLSSNFGDHAVRNVGIRGMQQDIQWMVNEENYTEFQILCCNTVRRERRHSAVAKRAASLLDKAVWSSVGADG